MPDRILVEFYLDKRCIAVCNLATAPRPWDQIVIADVHYNILSMFLFPETGEYRVVLNKDTRSPRFPGQDE